MDEHDWLAERFEENRGHLRAVAYRMLGSLSEADDAVQEAWLRLSRADTSDVENLGGWLTTVVGRVCLDMLRSRKSRREEPLDAHVPEPDREPVRTGATPSRKRCWPTRSGWRCWWCSKRWLPPSGSRSCCTTCSPCPSTRSRRSWAAPRPRPAARQPRPPPGARGGDGSGHAWPARAISTRQREVVDAFLAAARGGDFDALLAVLDPDVVLRSDRAAVARRARRGDPRRRGRGPAGGRGAAPGRRNRRSSTAPWASSWRRGAGC